MGLYTKIDKQLDKYFKTVSTDKSLSKQKFYLKILVQFFNFLIFL